MQAKKKYILLAAALVVGALLLLVLTRYHSNPRVLQPDTTEREQNISGNLKRVNKFLTEKDQERIRSFVKRRDWNMQTTGSGLWYMIYQHGEGASVESGMFVKLNYEIRLLDGTLCYSSDSAGAKVVQVDHGDEPRGLHEGIKYFSEGDRARLIIPPHLAHGLVGDGERIPARAILFYDITVLEASPQKIRR
ncbi:MAG TPA: FKBP-type peptidyl-prolyl cis-trans isomerase [Bacteroidales bacterium]|nr:FKBP-type peptidyl-prolyl cis-trans isomerase [Bacteroidales bacterium]